MNPVILIPDWSNNKSAYTTMDRDFFTASNAVKECAFFNNNSTIVGTAL